MEDLISEFPRERGPVHVDVRLSESHRDWNAADLMPISEQHVTGCVR
jgi:hypothetical protein